MATPQVLSRKANGVLPVAAAQATTDAPKATKSKVPVDGEKVVIRRLPPGMTEDECIKLLGEDWKVGNGKVDWFSYQPGKISQEFVLLVVNMLIYWLILSPLKPV